MKKIILLLTLSFFTLVNANGQTKKIALASHSGKKAAFTITGDGNFGYDEPNPIDLAVMRRYADSVRRADSIKQLAMPPHKQNYRNAEQIPFQRYCDSVRRADSIKKASESAHPTPKLPIVPERAKLIGGSANFGKPVKR
jgi:hypothetical protein